MDTTAGASTKTQRQDPVSNRGGVSWYILDDEGEELRNHTRGCHLALLKIAIASFESIIFVAWFGNAWDPGPPGAAWRRLAEASMERKGLWIYTRLVQRCTRREYRGVDQEIGISGR